MPSFQHLSETERNTVTDFLLNREKKIEKPVDKHSTKRFCCEEKRFSLRTIICEQNMAESFWMKKVQCHKTAVGYTECD
jgi:hypothetical protein